MSRPILVSPSLADAATITGSTTNADAGYDMLQTMQPGEVMSQTGAGPYYLECDFGSAQTWDALMFLFNLASSSALWRIRAATSQANLTASPTYDTGQALSLDGATQHASQASLTTPTSFTLEALVRPRSFSTLSSLFRLVAATSGTFDVTVNNGLLSIGGAGVTTLNATTLTAFDLVHIAVVVTPSIAQIYIDGELIAQGASALSFTGTITAYIGKAGSLSIWGNADFSEVRYWTVARTQEQIQANMRRADVTGTGLVGYWKFNGAATNSGSAGGSATLTGSPGYVNKLRQWASSDAGNDDRRHAMLYVPTEWTPNAAEEVSARWLRIDFNEAQTAGRLLVGPGVEFPVGPNANLFAFTDPSQREPMAGGRTSVNPLGVRQRFGPYPFMTTERAVVSGLRTVFRDCGNSIAVGFARDPDDAAYRHEGIGYGTLGNALEVNQLGSAGDAYAGSITIDGLG